MFFPDVEFIHVIGPSSIGGEDPIATNAVLYDIIFRLTLRNGVDDLVRYMQVISSVEGHIQTFR